MHVTLRRVRVTTVAVEKHYIFWACVCSLWYPACNAHAPHCHLSLVRFYNIFPHYLTNGMTFEKKKLLNIKCVLRFSPKLLSETFLTLRKTERGTIIFYVLLTVHLDAILGNDQRDALFLNVFILHLYMFRAASAHHQEVQIVLIHHLV
jgi:hypothetical protein